MYTNECDSTDLLIRFENQEGRNSIFIVKVYKLIDNKNDFVFSDSVLCSFGVSK